MKMYRNSLNLFDYTTIVSGYRIQWTTGNPVEDNTAVMSDYFLVFPDVYTISVGLIVIGYNSNKEYVGVYRSDSVTWEKRSSAQVTSFTVSSESTIEYIRLLSYGDYDPITNTLMVNAGSSALPYEPYNVIDWYGYKYKLRSSGAWSKQDDKKAPWT